MVWFTSVTASDQRDRSYTLSQADAVRAVRSGRYVSCADVDGRFIRKAHQSMQTTKFFKGCVFTMLEPEESGLHRGLK